MIGIAIILSLVASSHGIVQEDAKNRPVSKVITLLNDMTKQLETEAKEDGETFDTMMCWCETNDKGKTKAIADGESTIAELQAAIQSYTALSSKLNTEIANLENEVAANTDALEKATAVRQKELAEFNAEEKSSLQTIASLKGAVNKLAKHHDAAFLQTDTSADDFEMIKLMTDLKHAVHKNQDVVNTMLSPRQRKAVAAFVQNPDNFIDAGIQQSRHVSMLQGKAAPSAEIFGTLKQMKEGFETNLAASQKEEMRAQGEYEDVKHGKQAEIAAGTAQIDTKTNELADSDEKNAQSKKQLAETENTLAADTTFLASLKEQCAIFNEQYEERTKTRQLEIQAVSKAASFLSSDEAQDLVSRTFSFIQVGQKFANKRRNTIATALSKIASDSHDPRISTLALHARLDAFTKVKASIQEMIDTLAKEQEAEVQHKDFCVEQINANEKQTQQKEQEKGTLESTIQNLAEQIDKLKRTIVELKATIADLQVQLKRAGEDREKANSEFQVTVADQRATQKLLAGALNILKGFYDKASLVQIKQEPAGPPPPPGFKSYSNNAQSGGVMAMINQIIADAKAMEQDALKAEEEEQVAYETFTTETNESIDAATKESITCAETQAKKEAEKVETEMSRDGVMGELEALAGENADLHKDCDYTLKNFDLRQGARQSEMEALKQALSILSGANMAAFLQTVKVSAGPILIH
jgi:DNA repair exonuclease SbcCD ATPase subunit